MDDDDRWRWDGSRGRTVDRSQDDVFQRFQQDQHDNDQDISNSTNQVINMTLRQDDDVVIDVSMSTISTVSPGCADSLISSSATRS